MKKLVKVNKHIIVLYNQIFHLNEMKENESGIILIGNKTVVLVRGITRIFSLFLITR